MEYEFDRDEETGRPRVWMLHKDGDPLMTGEPVPCLDGPTAFAAAEHSHLRTRERTSKQPVLTWIEEQDEDEDEDEGNGLFFLYDNGAKTAWYAFATHVIRQEDISPDVEFD
ncbi:hypothetical protein ACGFYZ_40245, partial [Streptomyces sp. NPDC048330]|uniref:hypothetical protein n=1 Tax=Streptomyces sp. NPDC048330 TaxID=3365533 RepID=UPI0037111862